MIEVLSAGLYTTIQDNGRFGFRKYGVPLSGFMDSYSALLANQLVGNNYDCALMEITLSGPQLKFSSDTVIAITGAGFSPTLNNVEIPINSLIKVNKNSVLKFGVASYGLLAYLSVSGGFKTEKILGSYSYYRDITSISKLRKGDLLKISPTKRTYSISNVLVKTEKAHFNSRIIEVYKGCEFDLIRGGNKEELFNTDFTISSESNRMAYLLKGNKKFSAKEIITAPVQPGTVQLTPSGQFIVLMRDCQTTGGYARVFQLTDRAINRIAQKRGGESILFKLK